MSIPYFDLSEYKNSPRLALPSVSKNNPNVLLCKFSMDTEKMVLFLQG